VETKWGYEDSGHIDCSIAKANIPYTAAYKIAKEVSQSTEAAFMTAAMAEINKKIGLVPSSCLLPL
jgi:hypothetical protein